MEILDHWIGRISEILNKIGALVILPAMASMMTADVVLRYAFNAPLSWGLEASQHMLLLVILFGMVEGYRSGAHIRMDLFYRIMPGPMRRLVTLVYGAAAMGIFALLIRKGYEEAAFLKSINEVTQYLHMPKWLFAGLIVLVSMMIVLFFATRCWDVIRGRRDEVENDADGHGGMGIE